MILKKDRKLQKIYKEDLKITVMIVILFENLFKPRQRRLTVGMVTDFVSSIHNLKTVF
ncbi:hypothetical protein SMIG22_19460 [Streptococcus mitis]